MIRSLIACADLKKLENISEISIEKKELNDANLEECVSLALEESVINTDHTLVTSITTSGGELLKDNIFLVDMPGWMAGMRIWIILFMKRSLKGQIS